MRHTALALIAAAASVSGLGAQNAPGLAQLLERLDAYMLGYETQLSSVVADERFEQRTFYDSERIPDRGLEQGQRRTLESEVAFVRLPGGGDWLGFRDVKKVDNRELKAPGPNIAEVLASEANPRAKGQAIADASARHNLGLPRTVNVPTAALEIIHPNHRKRFAYELRGNERVKGTRTMVVAFRETTRPTILREPPAKDLISSGRIWIDPETGAVWQIDWTYQADKRDRISGTPPRMRVEFALNKDLAMLVPAIMEEVFGTMPQSGLLGQGRATYDNFRRFGTSARIVPQ